MKHEELTEKIIGVYYTVYNSLGYGFLEKVYKNAMAIELHKEGLHVVCQYPVRVFYSGQVVGEYIADTIVGDGLFLFPCSSVSIREPITVGQRVATECDQGHEPDKEECLCPDQSNRGCAF